MIISVTADRQFSLPPEAQINFIPGDNYEMVITEQGFLFVKIPHSQRSQLEESAQLYAEVYDEDDDLQELTASAIVGWEI